MKSFLINQGIYFAIFFVGIIVFYFVFIKPTDNLTNTTSSNELKVLKYFGGSYCPHSREGSRAYELIKDFESANPNVKVEYYWSGNNEEEFQKADAQYVPKVTNGSYDNIELSVNTADDITNKSDLELKNLVIANIYKQL